MKSKNHDAIEGILDSFLNWWPKAFFPMEAKEIGAIVDSMHEDELDVLSQLLSLPDYKTRESNLSASENAFFGGRRMLKDAYLGLLRIKAFK